MVADASWDKLIQDGAVQVQDGGPPSKRPYALKDALVRINDIKLSFEDEEGGRKPVLAGITAEVRDIVRPGVKQGQVVALLGPSGVGKTIFSRILAGLQEPTSGTVTIGADNTPVQAGLVGYVPQNYPLLEHRRVLGNLVKAARKGGATQAEAVEKAKAMLARFDLLDKADAFPAELSGGQRQRIAILRQLLCSKHYLVLDEPTTGLDPIMKDRVCELIRDVSLLDEENTIFVVSHDIPAMIAVADRLWLFGRDRDEKGVSLGARIQHDYDLISLGLAWEPNVSELPGFVPLLREIRAQFEKL